MKNQSDKGVIFAKAELAVHQQVWLCLADSYLDQELTEADWARFLEQLQKINLSLGMLRRIDALEVYPVLGVNLRSIAGNWTGFKEEDIIRSCLPYYQKPWNKRRQLRYWWCFQVWGLRKAFWREYARRTHQSPFL